MDVSACKELCDQDDNCEGYVDTTRNQCQFATTSDCPSACKKYNYGINTTLDKYAKCGTGYRGCFVKGEQPHLIVSSSYFWKYYNHARSNYGCPI